MLICPSFFDGRFDGIGRVSGAFFDAMAKMTGHRPFVLSANDQANSVSRDEGRAFGRSYWRMMFEAAFSRLLVRGITRRPEALPFVCTHLGLSPVARLLVARSRRSYVVFLHGIECWKPLRWRARWGLRGSAKLLFNSIHTRRTFLAKNPWASKIPSEVVPLGVSVPELAVQIDVPRRQSPEFRILCVGRMTKAEYYDGFRKSTDLYKGFKQLILAVGIVARSIPGVRLDIVGDGDARPDLEKWLGDRSERELVKMLGRVSDERLRELYANSDAFALPSEGEGFGLVFVEAMAHGLPCVCVDAGAAPEVVEDGITGLVAKPRDVSDIAAKLLLLAKDRALLARLSANAKRRFEESYTSEKFQRRIIQALELGTETRAGGK